MYNNLMYNNLIYNNLMYNLMYNKNNLVYYTKNEIYTLKKFYSKFCWVFRVF